MGDKYPALEKLLRFYQPIYNDNWENYITVLHHCMLEKKFLVANGNDVGTYANGFLMTLFLDFG